MNYLKFVSIYVFHPSNQTPLIKPLIRLSSLGIASSVATGIGGWRFIERTYPTGDAQLLKIGFKRNIPNPDLGADVSTGVHSSGEMIFKFQSYGCFQNFFPGATMKHEIVTDISVTSTDEPTLTLDSTEERPIGCALLNLAFSNKTVQKTIGETTQDVKVDNFIFKSEITVKNKNFGWSLWTGMKKLFDDATSTNATGSNMQFVYYLVFLKKKINDESWEIQGGYSWHDAAFSATEAKIHLVIPTKEDWYELIKNGNTTQSFRNYSGVWEVSDGGSEIFKDIEVWRGNNDDKDTNVELLGRESLGDANYNYFGYTETKSIYVKDKGWLNYNPQNIKEKLKKFYEPFKNKKGKWRGMKEYCASKSDRRLLSEEDLYKIKNFCYKK